MKKILPDRRRHRPLLALAEVATSRRRAFPSPELQTGKGALELCRQVRPDVILLDIMLPDSRRRLDICKGIRKDPGHWLPRPSTPFLAERARLRDGSHRRLGTGRQRLRGEALFRARADRAHQAAAPRPPGTQATPARVLEAGGVGTGSLQPSGSIARRAASLTARNSALPGGSS